MSVRDHELVKMVGDYLVAHANLNYVDLQDMVDTLMASSYRYSRMKKQVFANLVRKAYQVYCEQNNLDQIDDPDSIVTSSATVADNESSDSDIEIQDHVASSVIKNQMTNLYMSPKPNEVTAPGKPVKLPFRPAFEVPPSRASRQKDTGGQKTASPACSDLSSNSDEDDLEIIEEVHSTGRRNGNETKSSNATVVQTLQPIIKKTIDSSGSASSHGPPITVSSEVGSTNTELSEAPSPLLVPAGVQQPFINNQVPTVKVKMSLTSNTRKENDDRIQQTETTEKRGMKRKLPDNVSNVGANNVKNLISSHPPPQPRIKPKVGNSEGDTNSGLGGAVGKKIKKHVAVVQDSGVTFSDFGGNDKIIEDICKLLMHLKHPEIYRELGVLPPRGFLLHGAPGCGKTLLASAIAGELKMPMLKVAATELISGISGESENNIRDLFEQALSLAPCIIFIDEIDSITPKRETAQREMERRIVSQLLTCIDELGNKERGDQVLLIGATNRIETIDVALRRAGRFDREICLGIPDVKAREQILRVLFRNLRLSPDFDFSLLAKLTPGYVGADLQALMREAAVQAVDKLLTAQRTTGSVAVPSVCCNSPISLKQQCVKVVENLEKALDPPIADSAKETDQDPPVEKPVDGISGDKEGADDEPMETESSSATPSPSLLVSLVTPIPVPNSSEKDFLRWIRESAPVSGRSLENLCLHMEHFERALKYVQPSSKREGFATVPDTTWNDIGALTEIREELQVSILGPVKHASAFESLGLNSPAGVLLCGPPGCGKTLLAKAVANEAGINFISVKGPELLNMYVGESERAVRQCFLRAKNSSPCVIFFDELDALCPRRSDGAESGSTSRVVNQLLTEMDGMESRVGVFVMAATNRPDIIDPAILRPGRLDKVIFVNLPTPEDRFDILTTITKNGTRPRFADDIDLKCIALSEKLDGFTGADLAAIVREASIAAFRELVLETGKLGQPVCSDEDLKVFSRHFDIAILRTKPSVTTKDRDKYNQMKERYSSLLT